MRKDSGFTLVEMIMVIIITGLLAAYALPRFFNQDSFESRGFYDEVLNAVRYAQQLAVATNCDVRVTLGANSYAVNIWDGGTCDTGTLGGAAPDPVTGAAGFSNANSSVAITVTSGPSTFDFDALGTTPSDVTVSITGGYSFKVWADTGYIEEL